MTEYAGRSPNQLSGGQQQRVALARALVINPDVVLLDEPLSNLDAKLRLEMRDEIRRIHDELGTTMIYVTHDQKEALSLADRIAVMGMGEVRQIGDPRTVYTRPSSPFVAHFIGETNFIPGKVAHTGEETVIETAVGPLISSVPPDRPFVPGADVVCCIRPESIDLVSGSAGDEKTNLISASVIQIMYLGEHEQYSVRLKGDTTLKVVHPHPDRRKAEPGQEIWLTFDPSHVVALTPE